MSSLNRPSSNSGDKDLDKRLNAILSSPSDFSVASYLNLALDSSCQDDELLQRRMAELALQLQLTTQSCHEDIGRIGAELQAILPRCAADVGRISVGLQGMKVDAASTLEQAIHKNEQQEEVSSSMETLSTLHALQSNLNMTLEILQAAASWDSTLASIPPMLAQSNLVDAVDALAKLESGQRALRGMTKGREDRQASITKIRQQVQVMLQPQLLHALQNMHTRLSPLVQCVGLYTKLGKMDSLQQDYVKNRPQPIHKLWFSYTPKPQQDDSSNDDFILWLSGWYDAVLELLTEERRQSLAVFGSNVAPSILVQVLGECFRPLLSSFAKRLDSHSLESSCALYEATLSFLSLAYETIAASWLDAVSDTNNNNHRHMAAHDLYSDVMATFLHVASPFVALSQDFAKLERTHSQVATSLVVKDVHAVVNSVDMKELQSLQDATERLQGLTPFIFPLVQGSLARFELLNGGYLASDALSTMDGLLAAHASELSVAMSTLSAFTDGLVDNFDELHVHVALQVLKNVAGCYCRDLAEFETKTKERLAILCERMAAHEAHELQLQQAATGGSSSFLFPDSLSVVEIDSLLTESACGNVENSKTSLVKLQQLVDTSSSSIFPQAQDAMTRLASACHGFVFHVCFAVPRHCLGPMSTMSAWRQANHKDQFESYGTLPQAYITSVGENMLALVQALEPFASDEHALGIANQVMDGLQKVALQPWREFVTAAGCLADDDNHVVESLMTGQEDLSEWVLGDQGHEEEEEDEQLHEDSPSTIFCNKWLDVVGLAVTGRLLERIMRIAVLTEKGCDHLAADLNYLANVLSALGVSGHPHVLLGHFGQIVTLDPSQLKATMASRDKNHPIQAVLQAAEVRMLQMRGISHS